MVDFIIDIITEIADFFLNLWADTFGNRKEKKLRRFLSSLAKELAQFQFL